MQVFRVEHVKTGLGPYRGNKRMGFCHNDPTQHPNVYGDKGFKNLDEDDMGRNMAFGFTSLLSLRRWFNENDRVGLHKNGFHIVTFEVQKVYVSTSQAVFSYESAKRLSTMPVLKGAYHTPLITPTVC